MAEYQIAVFNYEFVKADRSNGSHNAYYARAALAETEVFFGITPWRVAGPGDPLPLPDDKPGMDGNKVEKR